MQVKTIELLMCGCWLYKELHWCSDMLQA